MSSDPKKTLRYNKFAQEWFIRGQVKDKWNLGNDYVEKPAMYSQLGELDGKAVLCMGCGAGEECGYIAKRGAGRVVGIDLSLKLVEKAKERIKDCEFLVMDMEKLNFPDNGFDMVFCSMAMHYLKDWKEVLSEVFRVLKPGGKFIFSVLHPIKLSSEIKREEELGKTSFLLGYSNDKKSGEFHIYGDYLGANKVIDCFSGGKLIIAFYSRSMSTIFREIQKSDFRLMEFLEPTAISETKKVNLVYWQIRQKIPLFVILKLAKG